MQRELELYIDCDGVIFNINKKAIDIANKTFNTKYDYTNNKDWWWGDYSRDTAFGGRLYFERMLDEEGFFRSADTIEGAVEYISKLYSEGYKIKFISSPHWTNKTFMTDRVEFLKEIFPWFKNDMLILTSDKGVCDKKFRVLIDDYSYNLDKFRDGIPLCFGQPYNEDYKGLRVKSWSEAYCLIKLMEEGR